MNDKKVLWDEFCEKYKILKKGVLLFETEGLLVEVNKDKKNPILKLNSQMKDLVIREVNKVIETNDYEGLIYMMYWKESNQVIPLYIGKSQKFGKEKNLNTNIKNITNNEIYFCRWGYDKYRHIGGLSSATFQENNSKYNKWAKKLFKKTPTEKPELNQPTYFWLSAWNYCEGPWKQFGSTTLDFLEVLLIGLANEIFTDTILNEKLG